MSMTLTSASGTLSKLRRAPWGFQRTFQTPLSALEPFVDTIFEASPELSAGSLTIDAVIFETRHLLGLPGSDTGGATRGLAADATIVAASRDDARSLLIAGLADGVDFYFVPEPKSIFVYADHDEYCTFYANARGKLSRVCGALAQAGFAEIDGFKRQR